MPWAAFLNADLTGVEQSGWPSTRRYSNMASWNIRVFLFPLKPPRIEKQIPNVPIVPMFFPLNNINYYGFSTCSHTFRGFPMHFSAMEMTPGPHWEQKLSSSITLESEPESEVASGFPSDVSCCLWSSDWLGWRMYIYIYICMYVCMHVCMFVCLYVCMFVCTHVCMYACMHVCM